MTRSPHSEEGRRLAEEYVYNTENLGVVDRSADLDSAARQFSSERSAVDFVLSADFPAHADHELVVPADAWERFLGGPVERILDAGCGAGATTLALANRYDEAAVVGVDVEETAIRLGRFLAAGVPRCTFQLKALEDLSIREGFDLIQCRAVLEHVRDPKRTLNVLLAHLRPGGVLYVETPNYLYPWEPHLRLAMLPKSPKWLLALQCRITGRDPRFIDHLNLSCDPLTITRWARSACPEIEVVDLMARKAVAIFEGREQPRVPSRARGVDVIKRLPGATLAARWAFTRLPIAPSVTLLFVKRTTGQPGADEPGGPAVGEPVAPPSLGECAQ